MIIKLSDLFKQRKNSVLISDNQNYKRCRIQVRAKGIILRDIVSGSEIKTKKQQVCHSGDFVVAEIDAKVGGFGFIPKELEGAIVSSHYFIFEIEKSKILPDFFELIIRSQEFQDKLKARGSTNYAAIRPHDFLNIDVELPKISDQISICSSYKEFVSKKNGICLKLQENIDLLNRIQLNYFTRISKKSNYRKMIEVAPIIRRPVKLVNDMLYPELGIRSFGKGTFHKPAIEGKKLGSKKIFQIQENDLIFSNVFAWEGAIAVAQQEDNGRFGSHRFISCLCENTLADPYFLRFYFLSEMGMEKIRKASPGSAGRNKTLGLQKLEIIDVPCPPIKEQIKFRNFYLKSMRMNSLLRKSVNDFDSINKRYIQKIIVQSKTF